MKYIKFNVCCYEVNPMVVTKIVSGIRAIVLNVNDEAPERGGTTVTCQRCENGSGHF